MEIPLACTLDAAGRAEREDEIRALGRAGLLSLELAERRAVLRFRPSTEIRERVAAVAAAESTCCAFLDFELTAARNATTLTISAPDGGEPALHELARLFGEPDRS